MDHAFPAEHTAPAGEAHPRAALICNPRSGTLAKMPDAVGELERAIEAAGFSLVSLPDQVSSIEERWQAAREAGATLIFAAGGDGTLRALAALALADDVTLALLPGGTMNRVCARLGVDTDPVSAVAMYTPGQEKRLDVGFANGEVFLFQSLLGAPARLLRFREMQRGGGVAGWLPLLRMALRKLRGLNLGTVRLSTAQGARLSGSAAVVTVPEWGEPPEFVLGVTRAGGIGTRLRQAMDWFRGRLSESPQAVTVRTSRLVAFSRRRLMRISLDGEMTLLTPPLRFRVAPNALRILAPRR